MLKLQDTRSDDSCSKFASRLAYPYFGKSVERSHGNADAKFLVNLVVECSTAMGRAFPLTLTILVEVAPHHQLTFIEPQHSLNSIAIRLFLNHPVSPYLQLLLKNSIQHCIHQYVSDDTRPRRALPEQALLNAHHNPPLNNLRLRHLYRTLKITTIFRDPNAL